ncbi:hypothetical protein ANN_15675 [Periplaneta americana]|uniref:Reverse transcriptase n=1 Tax=Periplaneta americana TaxID=6978 RepID=A0ABQ8SI91_PERAM|nr:hypothetical protein ANN_15675 [Periplaneta americana]
MSVGKRKIVDVLEKDDDDAFLVLKPQPPSSCYFLACIRSYGNLTRRTFHVRDHLTTDTSKSVTNRQFYGERTRENILCRRCHREPETLTHVLGPCRHGEVLRNSRHHRIRSMITEQFSSINFKVFEEVHGLADNGRTRRIDMIAIPPNNNNGYIIDPTVRFEKQKSQPEDVNRGKKNDICVRTVPYFMDKYGLQKIEVIGLGLERAELFPVSSSKPGNISAYRGRQLTTSFFSSEGIDISTPKPSLQSTVIFN